MSDRVKNPYCMRCGDTRGGPYGHESNECTWSRDDGHTVALPPTREQAREELAMKLHDHVYASDAELRGVPFWQAVVDAIAAAPPEVLAAALGGTVEHEWDPANDWRATVIVLPLREAPGT